MTQQYLVGQFSLLLGELERVAADWQPTVHELRRNAEHSPIALLPEFADEALSLIDDMCWASLLQGDAPRFDGCGALAAELSEFIDSACLIPEVRQQR